MMKSNFRDYAVSAFGLWAEVGSANTYRRRLWEEALREQHKREGRGGLGSPTEAALKHAQDALDGVSATLADLDAIDTVMIMLECYPTGADILKAVRAVYMTRPSELRRRGAIHGRVVRYASEVHADERTVYRWLAKARLLFAKERGLRTR